MKITASKENATSSQSSKPFFSKKGEGGFFAQTKEVEQPFFTPAISRQAAAWDGGNAQHTPFFQARSQPVIQPKLTINEPGDKYEQEADAMSDRVMRMSAPVGEVGDEGMVQTKPLNINAIQRKCTTCEQEEKVQRQEMEGEETLQTKPLMRKAADGGYPATPQLSSQLHSSKGGGNPLPKQTLGSMNQAFGADFSKVRIHTNSQAAEMSQGIQAKAFTHGSDIYFNQGQYSPETSEGKRLLGHELTHVVQQVTTTTRQHLQRTTWTPTHADERSTSGVDRFASQTFELTIPSLTGLDDRTSTENIRVSVFVPSHAVPGRNKIHVFFSPGDAAETGLAPNQVGSNAVMTHGMRGASDLTEWILIGIPGRSGLRTEDNGFNTINTSGIESCLRAAGRPTRNIDSLRMSSHSRGSRGLRETISRGLIARPVPERIIIFDAAFSSLDRALRRRGIPGRNMIALNVVESSRLTAPGATNISLPAPAMRAIGYSRAILNAIATNPSLVVPPAIRTQLLPLPQRGFFTTASPAPAGMTNIIAFARTHRRAILQIDRNRDDPANGFKHFIDANNLLRLGVSYSPGIDAHHLFVAELSHEAVD